MAAAGVAAARSTLTKPVWPRATPTASAMYAYRHFRPGQHTRSTWGVCKALQSGAWLYTGRMF